jgi:hypothetical protein
MQLQDIQEKINNLFAGTERKIVFWYDDDASYADDIDALQLEDGCHVDVITTEIEDTTFLNRVLEERVLLYER